MTTIKPPVLIGFTTETKAYITKYKSTLVAKKYDPTDDLTQLETDCAEFAKQDQNQETMKTDLKKQTEAVTRLNDALYRLASTTLDTAISKLGKTTPEGKEGARIRATLRKGGNPGSTPPTPHP